MKSNLTAMVSFFSFSLSGVLVFLCNFGKRCDKNFILAIVGNIFTLYFGSKRKVNIGEIVADWEPL